MESSDHYQSQRELARQRVEDAYRANMAMLPVEVQAIIEAIPVKAAKDLVKSNITSMMESTDEHILQHMWILLGGNLSYAHMSGHFDADALSLLTKFRIDLRARKYVSRGPFIHKQQRH